MGKNALNNAQKAAAKALIEKAIDATAQDQYMRYLQGEEKNRRAAVNALVKNTLDDYNPKMPSYKFGNAEIKAADISAIQKFIKPRKSNFAEATIVEAQQTLSPVPVIHSVRLRGVVSKTPPKALAITRRVAGGQVAASEPVDNGKRQTLVTRNTGHTPN